MKDVPADGGFVALRVELEQFAESLPPMDEMLHPFVKTASDEDSPLKREVPPW
jgi:hypothetical protein